MDPDSFLAVDGFCEPGVRADLLRDAGDDRLGGAGPELEGEMRHGASQGRGVQVR
jgi:hypothetical protein